MRTEITKSHLNNHICQHCRVKTSTVTPSFYYVFNISLSCNNSIPSFIGNLWRVLLLENHLKEYINLNCYHLCAAKSAVPPVELFPSAEATCTVTRHSVFAAVWRLKSFTFSRHNSAAPEFTCIVPDYPDVSVQIPWNCVPTDDDFSLTLKVNCCQ